jgi:phosphate transport system protein
MSVLLNKQIEKIKRMILAQGALVEQALQRAVRAVEERDAELAAQVVSQDMQIDLSEIDIEEECLATLALHQPVAHDLRFIVSVLKINSDLERIGDLAANMAEQGAALTGLPPIEIGPFGILDMAHQAQVMVKQALDALVSVDADLAGKVREMDDKVDTRHRAIYHIVEEHIRENIDALPQLIRIQITARHIERIADHAVNIAKDVIYLARGEIVRHRRARAAASKVQA